eukprot:GHVS01108454.1.p1 GENE.GHVS01108454.1~~GHVS01108454.1.p1  ORF type:complete len:270 (-),score=44.61 GHVS01108454.1:513-1322(-)
MGCQTSRCPSSSSSSCSVLFSRKIAVARQTKVLALRDMGLQKLPTDAFTLLDNITTCDLTDNHFKQLPPELCRWSKLQSLLLCRNRLTAFPSSLFGALQALTNLSAGGNRIRAIPEDLCLLTSLQFLDLRNNRITSIAPRAFEGLNRLTDLNLSQNRLPELPSSLYSLSAMTHLYVQDNHIVYFSEHCTDMGHLQVLDISRNHLTEIPSALLMSTNLSELWLRGNTISKAELMETRGFEDFAQRRKRRLDKQLDSRVVKQLNFSMCGLD